MGVRNFALGACLVPHRAFSSHDMDRYRVNFLFRLRLIFLMRGIFRESRQEICVFRSIVKMQSQGRFRWVYCRPQGLGLVSPDAYGISLNSRQKSVLLFLVL